MFSKAKRFEPILRLGNNKTQSSNEAQEKTKLTIASKLKQKPLDTPNKINCDVQSQCSSISSVKSFVTPKPGKSYTISKSKVTNSLKKTDSTQIKHETGKNLKTKIPDDIVKAQEVEIRNKDQTISEYNKQIEELKIEIATLQKKLNDTAETNIEGLDKKIQEITLCDKNVQKKAIYIENTDIAFPINKLQQEIIKLEQQCNKLENEVSSKQVELTSLEEVIVIRDSLCQDLQTKLTDMNTCLEETKQRLEMVKGHHALALEANESIRREYKVELETLKIKMDEEKQAILNKSKTEQEKIKAHYKSLINSTREQLIIEKDAVISELQDKLDIKEKEMKAKLEQIQEATQEKLKLCEIQFEERSRTLQEHCSLQESQIHSLETEIKGLKYELTFNEEEKRKNYNQLICLEKENEALKSEQSKIAHELVELKEEKEVFKSTVNNYENRIHKLTADVDRALKYKNKFEMSLSVTRDIVQVLTMRLRESDAELEQLEAKVLSLTKTNDAMESELSKSKKTLDNIVMECNEYKDVLVNILKSKTALAKEHNRIMEHNVTLIESLQNVEKEAYRELGSIKSELIDDVEHLRMESNSQIQMLRKEVEKKQKLCELATEHAGQATAAAEQSRALLSHAANEISRLEAENGCLQKQIQDQQSLVVELSLLRQENEELTMLMAKQSSMMDKMKKEMEQLQIAPKSPSFGRKTIKIGKENIQTVVSPLRERNH